MSNLIELIGKDLVDALEINARKDAKLYAGMLLIPNEVNGFYGWRTVTTPVEVTGFSYLEVCSTDYVDVYWNVSVAPSEAEEFHEQHCPYILGITYCITDPNNITHYRTWKLP